MGYALRQKLMRALGASCLAASAFGAGLLGQSPEDPSVSVIGGRISADGRYPWMGALVSADIPDIAQAQFCGCALINESWVLTAAHCLHNSRSEDVAVAFGNGDLSAAHQVVPIDLIVMHPNYADVLGLENDIALARLSRPMRGIPTISIGREPALSRVGAPVRIIGWGLTRPANEGFDFTDRLKEADLEILDRDLISQINPVSGSLSDTMLSVGSLSPLTTAYFGDSGGPLLSRNGDKPSLLGVASWVFGCIVSLVPYSQYTDVQPYLGWIDSIVDRDYKEWSEAQASASLDPSDPAVIRAYRLGGTLQAPFAPVISESPRALSVRARPFSPVWRYELDYRQANDSRWYSLEPRLGHPINEDGSITATMPLDSPSGTVLIRSTQTRRESSGPKRLPIAQGQCVSGSFGDKDRSTWNNVFVFDIDTPQARPDNTLLIGLSPGLTLDYELLSGTDTREAISQGRFRDFKRIEFESKADESLQLYISAFGSGGHFTINLSVAESLSLQASGETQSGSLHSGDFRIGASDHAMDAIKIVGHNAPNDIFVIADGTFDTALSLWDARRLKEIGQSRGWGRDSPEFFIFSGLSPSSFEDTSLELRILNAEPGEYGDYTMEAMTLVEPSSLSLADEFEFMALTANDRTSDTYLGLEYVDRIELTGLGNRRVHVSVNGLAGFAPAFAVRNILSGSMIREFPVAFCFENSVISFNPRFGQRYEVIIAGSEESLNSNYFLEVSTTAPEDPYEGIGNAAQSLSSKMQRWMQRRLELDQAPSPQ